jgi:hypothetical protein
LLGLSPETALPICEGGITPADCEEAVSLLQSVVGHWTILKNTSVDSLRSTFLQRSGLLLEEEEGFKLVIESQSFDMLLGSLPWGVSVVKLPWMKKPLYTQW